MERLESGVHHFEVSFTSKCMKSSSNLHIIQNEPTVIGSESHDFLSITGTGWDWPVVDCGAPFLTLLNDTLADFHAKVSHLSSFELTFHGIDSEVVVLEDSKNLGRVFLEFLGGVRS